MDNPFIEQSQKHAIADLKGLNIQILWRLSSMITHKINTLNWIYVFFVFSFISADDDLDAIAMHDMGPERMVQHHHVHGEHREHRLHSREFDTFFSHLYWKLYERHWISNEKSCAVCSSVNDRCGEWRGRRTQDQRATVGSFAEIFGRLLCVGLFALLGQFPEAHQPFCLRRIHWTLYHVVHRGQHALHGTWSPRHERGDESRPQNGKLCNHSITILAWHWKWFSSIIIWKLVLHGHIRHWSHIQIDCHQPEILF